MRFITITILSLAAITCSKPLESTQNGDLIVHYLTELSKFNIIKKEQIKKHIFTLMQDENSALVQHLAEICHNGNVDKLTSWSNDVKVRYNTQIKNQDLSKQIQGIARTLSNKINHCTKQYIKNNGGDTKPSMPFSKVFKELVGIFLEKEEINSFISEQINQNVIEPSKEFKTEIENTFGKWVSDDFKNKALAYINKLKNEEITKGKKLEKSINSKINNIWSKFLNFFKFGNESDNFEPVKVDINLSNEQKEVTQEKATSDDNADSLIDKDSEESFKTEEETGDDYYDENIYDYDDNSKDYVSKEESSDNVSDLQTGDEIEEENYYNNDIDSIIAEDIKEEIADEDDMIYEPLSDTEVENIKEEMADEDDMTFQPLSDIEVESMLENYENDSENDYYEY